MTRVGKLIVSAATTAALLWGHVAAAQSVCLPKSNVIEARRSIEGGSFTIIVARPDGVSCVIASGLAWVDAASDADDAEGT